MRCSGFNKVTFVGSFIVRHGVFLRARKRILPGYRIIGFLARAVEVAFWQTPLQPNIHELFDEKFVEEMRRLSIELLYSVGRSDFQVLVWPRGDLRATAMQDKKHAFAQNFLL